MAPERPTQSEFHCNLRPMRKSIAKNYILNVTYQVIALLLPLVTAPYLTRVLSSSGIGQYNFTYSLNYYFVLLAAFGFGNYAQREIARAQGDKGSQSVTFWEIILLRVLTVSVSIGVSVSLFFFGVYQSYGELMLFWVVMIAAELFDITFFFQGNEEFGKIVWRNLIIKLLSLASVFIFVRKPEDVWIYVLIAGGSRFIGNLSIWFYLPKYLVRVGKETIHPWKHFRAAFRLFLPAIAVALYSQLDRTIIGLVVPGTYEVETKQMIDGVETIVRVTKRVADDEVAFYSEAESIVKVAVTFITAMGTVMIPRNSSLVSRENEAGFRDSFLFGTNFVWFLGIPIVFGIAAVAGSVIPWFLAPEFGKTTLILQMLSPLALLLGLSNAFGVQFMIPKKMDRRYALCILVGAAINAAISIPLVYFFQSSGAVFGTLIAEASCIIMMAVFIRKHVSLKEVFKQSWKYLLCGGVMFAAIYPAAYFLPATPIYSVLLIAAGIVIYLVMLTVLRDSFFLKNARKATQKLSALFSRKKTKDNDSESNS